MKKQPIKSALELIFQAIGQLKREFPSKEFTIDGTLVGDIGEVIATLEYDIKLYDVHVSIFPLFSQGSIPSLSHSETASSQCPVS